MLPIRNILVDFQIPDVSSGKGLRPVSRIVGHATIRRREGIEEVGDYFAGHEIWIVA